ncbi:3'(2'),5'-bisphosphate nucleotidase CysQ [Psychroflexus salarius]|uniref:3'(2'),5'-bisphosphate nucleotidase CysQ n=1 Tax=Psychroflexus salarius TaxID=1155689 RepID=UPI00093460EB|nr:3'(2'),5'-bisphosphate nucleotidase CysQ [Psychroflexus salarius]
MNKLHHLAITAAIEAGEEIMKIYATDFEVAYKSDDSPLTLADQESNRVIMSYLSTTEIPIISEENKAIDYKTRQNWSSCWIVDPIDGTKEFVKKNGEFTVNIALVEDQKPIFGVIYVPATRELYVGDVKNRQSIKVEIPKSDFNLTEVLSQAKTLEPKSATSTIEVVGSRSHMNDDTKQFINTLEEKYQKPVEIVSKGSSLKFCLVAEGKADVYPRYAPTMEWDTAAGQAICSGVGLKVISLDTNKEMLYNRENLLNGYFHVTTLS